MSPFAFLAYFFAFGEVVEPYKQPLKEGLTLCVFNDDTLIFSDKGKWLTPLFALEEFLQTYEGDKSNLAAHDTAAGKAAAILMVRMGIKRVHINLMSELALSYYLANGVEASYEKKIEKLACKTETLLETLTDSDEMYRLLRLRAKLVRGVSVELQDASFGYDGDLLFSNLNITLPEGERLLIQGDNGKGKTTLLKMLMGKLEPTSGKVLIDGLPPSQIRSRTIGYIKQQQTQQQFPVSVREVVSMATDSKLSKERQKWEIDTALRRVGIQNLQDRNFYTLSGGERQKVSLARCLCQKARLLLLDEPTSFLDSTSRQALLETIRALTLNEMPTIIVVTHDKQLEKDLAWPTLTLGLKEKEGGDHE
jgi:zinc transport system ATP-binding protein